MSQEKVALLKRTRGPLRTAVTNCLTKIEIELSKTEGFDCDNLEELIESLTRKFEHLSTVEKELEPLYKDAEFDSEFEKAEEYRDKVGVCKYRAAKKIKEIKLSTNSKKQYDNDSEADESLTETKLTGKVRIKLPKLSIPKFYGEVSQWLSFWNSFESAIHKNESLDKVDKFNYLKAHLGGSALNTVEGFSISDSTYDSAIELLKDRFAKKDLLIHTHMNSILNMQTLKSSNDVYAFRKFYDNCTTHIRSLESLGLTPENYGSILCPLMLKLLPSDLVLEYNKNESVNAYSDIENLIAFLSKALTCRERTALMNTSETRRRPDCKQNIKSDSHIKWSPHKFEHRKSIATAAELISAEVNEKPNKKCVFCESSLHTAINCEEARNLTLEERKSILIKKGICFRCLENKKHVARFCRAKVICDFCSGKTHCSIFCYSKYKEKEKDKSNNSLESAVLTNQSSSNEVYLQTLVVRINNKGKEQFVRTIIDTGSQKSYVSKFVAEKMKLKGLGEKVITHGLFGGAESTERHNIYSVKLKSLDGKHNCVVELMDQSKICASIPKVNNLQSIKDLKDKGIFLSDISPKSKDCLHENNNNEIHVLLGADVAGQLITGEVEHLSCGLVAVNTKLGWTVMGRASNNSEFDSSLLVLSLHVNEAKITDLWNLDALGILDPSEKQSREEIQDIALKHFKETVSQNTDGRYQVRIPWLDGHPSIEDNKLLSKKRLNNTVKSLKSVGKLKDYEQVFNEWEDEGIIERVENKFEDSQPLNVHYLPHRAVFKEHSTTQTRPVFDGSARGRNSVSLNDCIEKGPNLIELIPSILNRFRLNKIGVVADIRKAFLQIALHENDRNFLRFLWWKDGNPMTEITYRHCRVVFGISCSPFLLAATLTHHLDNAPEHLRSVANKLKDSMYVDNCVASVSSIEELEYFRSESQKLLASAKFELRGWCCNRYVETPEEPTPTTKFEDKDKVPLLGLTWNAEDDTLSCDLRGIENDESQVTKRKILSLAHKIFDPIGFTCPVTLIPKLLLQECWAIKVSWDAKVPDHIAKEFSKWKAQIPDLEKIKIPRRLSIMPIHLGNLSLHTFCDASKSSYATCVFLRVDFQSEVTCQLIQARSRVAPLKKVTIPRLELIACSIGARLADSVKTDLRFEDIDTYYWSDSMDALHWIRKDGPWATFVANRVKEISRLSPVNSWNFVPGNQNPADLPSRGCSPKTLARSEWWKGPDWLLKPPEYWPKSEVLPDMKTICSEQKKTIVTASNSEIEEKFYNRYSSYTKILRITAWIYRFFENVKGNKKVGEITAEELGNAENTLWKLVQQDASFDVKDKSLKILQATTDSNGLIRVKTRIFMRDDSDTFRYPILLPSKNSMVEKLIRTTHEKSGHIGVQTLMKILREKYWILKCRKSVKEVVRRCMKCQRFSVRPIQVPTAPLPIDRVRDAAIFEIVGIDFAGPLILKEGYKAWIVVFTCAVFRAIHLEIATALSTENFLQAFRRFIARRGRPSIVYTDNGTNFVGANNLLAAIDWAYISTYSSVEKIVWKFIPPSAPWWGGWWERLIGMLKNILRRVLGKARLNLEEINTIICDCENMLNERPLTYLSDDIEDLTPLSPSMFLHEIRSTGVPDLDELDMTKLKKRFVYRQRVRDDLRKRFRSEYLGQLRQHSKYVKDPSLLKVGDIVLVSSDNSKRLDWPLAKIVELYPGRDGIVRVARIRLKTGQQIRPVQRLCPLEIPPEAGANMRTITEVPTPLLTGNSRAPVVTRHGRQVRAPERYVATCVDIPQDDFPECQGGSMSSL